MRQAKVLHVATIDSSLKFLLLPQIKYLISKGFDVSMVASAGQWSRKLRETGLKVDNIFISRKINPFTDFSSLVKLSRYIRKNRFDIVHTHTSKAGFIGRLAAKITGVPIILHTIHGFPFDEGMNPIKKYFYVFLEKVASCFTDQLLSQNSEDVQLALKYRICVPNQITRIGNGIDINRFKPDSVGEGTLSSFRKSLGVSDHLVLMIAELIPRKGCFDFLKAMQKVLDAFPNVKGVLVGDGPLKSKLEKFKSRLGISESIILPCFQENVLGFLALADVYVLPSYREGLPRSIIEAMAMGKPVVATNIRGCREAVEDGRTGILVPVRDAQALAEAIIYLLQNEERAQEMGRAGRKRAEELFDERKVFQRVEAEYRQLLTEKCGSLRTA